MKKNLWCPICGKNKAYWEDKNTLVCESCGYKMTYSERDYETIVKEYKGKIGNERRV
jgi:ribosomal protein L37E